MDDWRPGKVTDDGDACCLGDNATGLPMKPQTVRGDFIPMATSEKPGLELRTALPREIGHVPAERIRMVGDVARRGAVTLPDIGMLYILVNVAAEGALLSRDVEGMPPSCGASVGRTAEGTLGATVGRTADGTLLSTG